MYWHVVLIAFVVGIAFVFSTSPEREKVPVFPTPDNVGRIEYEDRVGTCFQFRTMEAACDSQPPPQRIPLQTE